MPELPEVEWFRQVLLALVDEKAPIAFELHGENPPRKWVSSEDVNSNTGKWCCADVLRKGKQLCMVLEKDTGCGKKTTKKASEKNKEVCYFYLHMGMTGRLVSPTMSCTWGHKYVSDSPDAGEEGQEQSWPPRFTYLVLTSGAKMVAFADPRKFGACHFEFDDGEGGSPSSLASPSLFDGLAPDALAETATPEQRSAMAAALAGQRLGVKALILDQKRVVSGVGNWVADEVLYGCEIHPDQSHLTEEQALAVVEGLRSVVSIAVDCLDRGVPYPDEWLFGYRWTKKKAGKDHAGRNLSFVTSGGRTSAIVASLQKLRKTNKKAATVAASKTKAKGRGREKEAKLTSSPETKEKATAAAKGDEEEKSAAPRKRKVAGSEVMQEKAVKRKRTNPSSSNATTAAATSTLRRNGLRNTNGTDLKPNADDHKTRPKNKQHQKKETVKKKSLSGEQKKEDSITSKSIRDTAEDEESAEALFRREKKATLEGVDKSVKDDFRRIGFAKWQKDWLPVIQLGPYDVPPGPVRDNWMKLFRKNKGKRMQKRLVYWYGSKRDNLSNSFSFVNEGSVIGYEEGMERGVCDGISAKIKKKMERNARLTAKETLLLDGLKEVRDESALSRGERLAWLNVEEEHAQ